MSQSLTPPEITYLMNELRDDVKALKDSLYRRPEGVLYRLEVLERGFSVLEAKIALAAWIGAMVGGIITGVILKLINLGG
jgi:hypothetical protein